MATKTSIVKSSTYRYTAAAGATYGDDEAEVIGSELEAMAAAGIKIEPPSVVDRARPDSSPLHKHFNWDDASAAESWRVQQARSLCNHLQRVEIVGDTKRVDKAMFSLCVTASNDDTGDEGEARPQYVPVKIVTADKALRKQAIERLWCELESWRHRAESLDAGEFQAVFEAMDAYKAVE